MKFAPFAIAGVFFVYLLGQLYFHNVLFAIPSDADETYFEAIAFNISQGKGFSGEFSEEFVKPYLEFYGEHYLDSYINEIQSLGINSTTTYRPPLFPGMLGVLYYLFGRHFILLKLLNAGFLAFGAGILVAAAQMTCGRAGAIAIGIWCFLDPLFLSFSRLGLSEASIFFIVCLLMWALANQWSVVKLGVLLGIGGLARTFVALWSILIAMFLSEKGWRERILLVVISLLILSPWAIRNSVVLGRFAPLGSQGGIVMGMIYGPNTLVDGGNWTARSHADFVSAASSYRSDLFGTAREAAVSRYGQEIGNSWLKDHLAHIPELMLRRTWSLWWLDTMPAQQLLIVFSLLGLLTRLGRKIIALCAPILIAHTLTIALTCNIPASDAPLHGRYLFVLHPCLMLCFAGAFAGVKDVLLNAARR